VGKLADLVILARNPLKGDPATIKDITVVETIKEGRTIFRKDPAVKAAQAPFGGDGLPCPHELVGGQGKKAELSPEARNTLALLKGVTQ
jgi:hypothetical protein